MDEPIEVSFGWVTRVGPKNCVLNMVQIPQGDGAFTGVVWPTVKHWSHCCSVRSKKSITASARLLHCSRLAGVTFNFTIRYIYVRSKADEMASLV